MGKCFINILPSDDNFVSIKMNDKRLTEGVNLEDGVLLIKSAFPSFLPSVFKYLIPLRGTVSMLLAWDWEHHPPSRLAERQDTLWTLCAGTLCAGWAPARSRASPEGG